jgi:hypothetical protein
MEGTYPLGQGLDKLIIIGNGNIAVHEIPQTKLDIFRAYMSFPKCAQEIFDYM